MLLWSSGFIGAKFGLPDATPMAFLLVRSVSVAVVLTLLVFALRVSWPRQGVELGHQFLVGALIQGLYLAGFYVAIDRGMPAGTAALVVSLQPLVIGLLAGPFLGEQVSARQWIGLVIGVLGCAMVVWRQLYLEASLAPFIACLLGLAAIVAGNLYQKRFIGQTHPLAAGVIQQAGAVSVVLPLLFLMETPAIEWTARFLFALSWMTLAVGVGAYSLLITLLRRGEASKVSSLFFLVPPVTAVMAWAVFGETLGPVELLGMAITVGGVALVSRSKHRPQMTGQP